MPVPDRIAHQEKHAQHPAHHPMGIHHPTRQSDFHSQKIKQLQIYVFLIILSKKVAAISVSDYAAQIITHE